MPEPLVLLPGLSCDAAVWQPVVDRLPELECIVPATPPCDDLGAMAAQLLPRLPSSFALAGHSMGARVALEIVRREPGRVTRLALLDTGFRARARGEAGEREREARFALLAIAREQGMRAMGEVWTKPMVHPSRLADRGLMYAILDMIERSDADRFEREIHALLSRPEASDVLERTRGPTLVGCGREDGWAPVEQHRELAERVRGSRLQVFERCGHMSPMERPQEVAAALRELVAGSAAHDRRADDRRMPAR